MVAKKPKAPGFWQRHGRMLLALAILFLFVHDIFGTHGFLAMRRTQKEIDRVREDLSRLNEDNRRLADQVKALRSDPKLIEKIARDELGLARPGEVIIKVPAPAQPK
jgi:cell division protein FtsB